MQIQIGIDIVLILAFLAYLSVVTGWNSKNKAAYIKQFRHVPISLLFKEIRYMYFISMACVLITIILVDWRIYNVASYFDALSVSLWIFIIYFTNKGLRWSFSYIFFVLNFGDFFMFGTDQL
ncbi:hypothetical protein [Acinetobacter sp. 723929]|uniref:hypothetical protein n=1 Tax=Acinetobacter sp. 723929 TaxID=1310711 RepID=UPI0006802D5F|nr:hypothetical protein [Acinetobacter sp. 723929]